MNKKTLNIYDNEYIKFEHDGDQYCVLIHQEDGPESPRDWENLGIMVCWHRRYNLGDQHDHKSAKSFFVSLAETVLPHEALIDKVKSGETNLYIEYTDDPDDELPYELRDDSGCPILSARTEDELFLGGNFDEILDWIDVGVLRTLLGESDQIAMLPLYLYDHSGITMNTSGFSDPWDSCQVGYIYMTKEVFLKETGYTEAEWPQRADEMMRDEVKNIR